MLAKTSVGDVYLRFHHTYDQDQIIELAMQYLPPQHYEVWKTIDTIIQFATVCEISFEGEVYSDAAFCSENDVLSRARGRKKAMSRAFQKAPFTKAVRQEIWDIYFEKTNAFPVVPMMVPTKLYEALESLATTLETDAFGALSAMLESCRVVNDVSLSEVEEPAADKPAEEVKADEPPQAATTV